MPSKGKLKNKLENLEEKHGTGKNWWGIEAEPEDRMLAFTSLAWDSDKPTANMSGREYAEHKKKLKEFIKLSKYMRENNEMPDKDIEEFEHVGDFNRILEERIAFNEYREKHRPDKKVDRFEGKDFEDTMKILRAIKDKERKLKGIYEKLEETDRLSMDILKEKAKEENIDGNLLFEWLERERLLLEMFGKERDTK